MIDLNTLSKRLVVVLPVVLLAYFAFDTFVESPQRHVRLTGSATLSWTVPTENEDSSPLTNLAGYTIRYWIQGGQSSNTIYIDDPETTSYKVENLPPGSYYFALTAVKSNGSESTLSNIVAKTVP